jgi:chemosensory pili system protein ChpA (sensor histidine kinase/response regulator)
MLPEQQERIMGYFIEEARDHLNTIEQGLLSLQTTIEDPDLVNELFRAAHSVKGGAAMLGLTSIQHIAHRLEDNFKILQEGKIQVDQELESVFLRVFDVLQELLEKLSSSAGIPEDFAAIMLEEVEPLFADLNTRLTGVMPAVSRTKVLAMTTSSSPSQRRNNISQPRNRSSATEESAMQLVFNADVTKLLREMLEEFKQPDKPESRNALTQLCQKLKAAGESFDLRNWLQLIDAAENAIMYSGNNYKTLAPIILKEIKQAKELVVSLRESEIIVGENLRQLLPTPATVVADLEELLSFTETDTVLMVNEKMDTEEPLFEWNQETSLEQWENPEQSLLLNLKENSTETTWWDEELWSEEKSVLENDENEDFNLMSSHQKRGPEVGMAELNSLADLFEEIPDLEESWDDNEMEILSLPANLPEADFNIQQESQHSEDFTDLLFDDVEDEISEKVSPQTDEFASLFGENFLAQEMNELDPTITDYTGEESLILTEEIDDFEALLATTEKIEETPQLEAELDLDWLEDSSDNQEDISSISEASESLTELFAELGETELPNFSNIPAQSESARIETMGVEIPPKTELTANIMLNEIVGEREELSLKTNLPHATSTAIGKIPEIAPDDIDLEALFNEVTNTSSSPNLPDLNTEIPELTETADIDLEALFGLDDKEQISVSVPTDEEETESNANWLESLLDLDNDINTENISTPAPLLETPVASISTDSDQDILALFLDELTEPENSEIETVELEKFDQLLESMDAQTLTTKLEETALDPEVAEQLLSGIDLKALDIMYPAFDDLEALLKNDSKEMIGVNISTDIYTELEQLLQLKETLSSPSTEASSELKNIPTTTDLSSDLSNPNSRDGSPLKPHGKEDFSDMKLLLDGDDVLVPVKDRTNGTIVGPPRGGDQRTRKPRTEQTMRVPVRQLDNLSNLMGELVVNRNSLEQDQERMRQFLENLLHQVTLLSDVSQRMQDFYERSLLEIALLANRQQGRSPWRSSNEDTGHNNSEWRPEEMDRFTPFHSLAQEIIELIVRVRESAADIEFLVDEADQVTRQLRQVTTQLQEGLTKARMMPLAHTTDRLHRAVRDISVKCGKKAQLIVEGKEILIDKMLQEQLYDPMTHLVNNAITHGIETPEIRQAAGKHPTGRITIKAFHQGNQTVISISDDGAGINPEIVKSKAVKKNLITAAQAKKMSRAEVYDMLFLPGFSTKDTADDFSGRGVGMDVVRTNLTEIRGSISIDSTVGKGTVFSIRLPLVLSISKALCCISDRARIAFPMDGVEDMFDVPKEHIQVGQDGQSCIEWRGSLLPFKHLRELLKYSRHITRANFYGGSGEVDDLISVVVLRSAGIFLAVQVDQVSTEQEIVIKQLEGPIPKPIGIAGATVLGDGRIVAIADVLELIDLATGRLSNDIMSLTPGDDTSIEVDISEPEEPTVLIVDDSITVRSLLSITFEKSGYRVEQARDGKEAWEKLKSGLPCDIVFCDIEMPRMDGLELLSRMQKDPQLSNLPIAMLTSRGADRHKQMAYSLGARGYFTKPYLEEHLLDAAARMLKGEVVAPATA